MECRDCPYMSDYRDTINNLSKYGLGGYEDEIIQNFWCDKVGGRIGWYGQCSDSYLNEMPDKKRRSRSNKKKRNKRERDFKYKNHLETLIQLEWFPSYVIPVDKNVSYNCDHPIGTAYYKRLYRGSRSKLLKKLSNKKIRRYKGYIPNGRWCYKIYDYWWEMY